MTAIVAALAEREENGGFYHVGASLSRTSSLAPALAGGRLDRHAIHWHYPHYHPGGATPFSAIRAARS